MNAFWPYLLVFLGVAAEGEVALFSSVVLSSGKKLQLEYVFLTAILGTATSDWFWYFSGRYGGKYWLNKNHKWRANARKAKLYIKRYPILILFGYRFTYGIRTVLPLIIGMSQIPMWKFLLFSLTSIIVWTMGFGLVFYFLSDWFLDNLEFLKTLENIFYSALILALGVIGFILLRRRRKLKLGSIK